MRPALRHDRARPPADIAQAAAYWSARRRLGLNDDADEALFAQWRIGAAEAEAFRRAEAAAEMAGALASDPEVLRLRRQARALVQRRTILCWTFLLIGLGGVAGLVWAIWCART